MALQGLQFVMLQHIVHTSDGWHWKAMPQPYGTTHFREAQDVAVKSADIKGESTHQYNKLNIIYTAASVENVQAAFARSRALSLTMDELSFLDTSVLQVFASSPATPDVATGWCCPPQLLPEMSIDLQSKKIALRIESADKATAGAAAKPKPGSDELVCSWHVCQGIENAIKNLLPEEGLLVFKPKQPWPAGPGRFARRGRDGRWARKLANGQWQSLIYGAKAK